MNILGIETSCDETAAAVVRDGREVLGDCIASQIALHAEYGGVVPELAAREHLRALQPVVDRTLTDSGCSLAAIDAIAVTSGPGLIPALLVGVSFAKGLAAAVKRPFFAVNHFLAHIYAAFFGQMERLQDPSHFPLLALVVSGGHTALVLIAADGRANLVGRTLDDAAGEAFDKAAKILGLGYPGGPIIDRLAADGDPRGIRFPRGLSGSSGKPRRARDRFNFSFSGVKTALLYHARGRVLSDPELRTIAASYQAAIVDVLVAKTTDAARHYDAGTIVLCGGVACNRSLRQRLDQAIARTHTPLLMAEPRYCTDNAAMIAGLAYHSARRGQAAAFDTEVQARLQPDLGCVPFGPASETLAEPGTKT